MKFKNLEAEHEWEQTVAEAPKHDKMVGQAIAYFVNWIAAMEARLEQHSYESDDAFNEMAEACLCVADEGQDLTFKQLTWVLTWAKRVWIHGNRIENNRLF